MASPSLASVDEGGFDDYPDMGFGPGGPAEAMPPGTPLHFRAERAVAGAGGMSDDGLIGVIAAARRLRNRAEWLEMRATREFARRRWEAAPQPVRTADGKWRLPNSSAEHAADELAFQLTDSRQACEDRMELSLTLRDRLPHMDALLAEGRIDRYRCQVVRDMTAILSDDDARLVDERIAPDAPDLRYDALRRRAAKLAMQLDPTSDRERKQRATRKKARVEKFTEKSGNWAYAGRELPVDQVLASEAHIRGLARYLRVSGLTGSLRELELMVYLDLTQGRDPRARIPGYGGYRGQQEPWGGNAGSAADQDQDSPRDDRDRQGDDSYVTDDVEDTDCADERGDEDCRIEGDGEGTWPGSPAGSGKSGGHARFPAKASPFPAKINLLVPIGTLLGWSTMPGEAGRDIIDPAALRDLVQACSHHPATRWCVSVIGDDRTAAAHGCARGQHTWDPRPRRARDGTPSAAQLEQLGQLLGRLKAGIEPIAHGACDHRHREDRYRPGRQLQDLVRARDATCPAPGCEASAFHADLDHTRAWPDCDTDECNLGTACRHHHRTKQAPGWTLEQPAPGEFRWTTPSGRVYRTGPARYDV